MVSNLGFHKCQLLISSQELTFLLDLLLEVFLRKRKQMAKSLKHDWTSYLRAARMLSCRKHDDTGLRNHKIRGITIVSFNSKQSENVFI